MAALSDYLPFIRRRNHNALAARTQRGLVSSAAPLNLADRTEARRVRVLRQGWQDDAWAYHDTIGEIRFARRYLANSARRMRLYPAVYVNGTYDDAPEPLDAMPTLPVDVVDACNDAMKTLGSGRLAISQIMHDASSQLSIAGEGFVHGQTDPQTGLDTWRIRSIGEITVRNDEYVLREVPVDAMGVFGWLPLDPEHNYVSRIWTPHPKFQMLADSPMRSILDSCEELLILSRTVRATGRSRLAGAGILKVPEGLSIAQAIDDNLDPKADPFIDGLTEAMLSPIGDEGTASAVVPLVVRGNADALAQLTHMTMDRPIDPIMMQQRDELIGRIATGIDLPKEVLTGVVDLNHWCVDDQTQALTPAGWVDHADLQPGDTVLTLNHDTGLSEWNTVEDIYRAQVADEPMLRIDSVGHDSLTTLNHRWPVIHHGERQWRTSDTLRNADLITTAAPCAALPAEAKWADDLVELVAWYWTEGSMTQGMVTIAQSHGVNPARVARIRGSLTEVFGPSRDSLRASVGPAWRESVQQNTHSFGGPVTVFHLNTAASAVIAAHAPGKLVTTEFVRQLTRSQLELFIDVSLQGDGWHYRSGAMDIFQSADARLDGIELAGILAGYSVSRRQVPGGYALSLSSKPTVRPVKAAKAGGSTMDTVPYTGTVWCPVTRNATWLARRAGRAFFTGNSAWQVSDDTFRHHIEPHVQECVDCLTVGYFRDALMADPRMQGANAAWVPRLTIWYDPTDLVTHPDRSTDALALHERLVISDASLREATGFTNEDEPSPLEIELRMVRNTKTFPPNVLEALFHVLDPSLNIPPINESGAIPGMSPTGVVPAVPDAKPVAAPALPGPPPTGAGTPTAPSPSTPVIAASGPPVAHGLSRRLVDIDRELRMRLQVAASHAMNTVLSRAGAKVRSKLQKDERLRTAIAHTPNPSVTATLGPAVVATLGIPGLVDTDWSDVQAVFTTWSTAAQRAALDATTTALGLSPDDPAVQAVVSSQGTSLVRAWNYLSDQLTSLAHDRLYSPDPGKDVAAELDAANADTIVPTNLIRNALNVLGGGNADQTDTGASFNPDSPTVTVGNDMPMGQVGTGSDVTGLLSDSGASQEAYTWVHGFSVRPFEPHEALDGVEFQSFDDEALANSDSFPANEYFVPGDHWGCTCDYMPMWALPSSDSASSDTPPEGEA